MEPAEVLATGGRLDLNRATRAELELLPGIGPSRARAMLRDRELRGDFRCLEDIQRVKGLGPAAVRRLRGLAKGSLEDRCEAADPLPVRAARQPCCP